MTTPQEHKERNAETLNGLIEDSLKLIDGYQLALDRMDTQHRRDGCRKLVDDYMDWVRSSQAAVRERGTDPVTTSAMDSVVLTLKLRMIDHRGDDALLEALADTEQDFRAGCERVHSDFADDRALNRLIASAEQLATQHIEWLHTEASLVEA